MTSRIICSRCALAAAMAVYALGAGPIAALTQDAPHVIATFREMPKTVTLPDGTLMAFMHPITGEMKTVTARLSADSGKTWSAARTLFDLPLDRGGFGYTQVFIDRAGELHLFLFCDANTGQIRPLATEAAKRVNAKYGYLGELDIWEAHTTDQRAKWLAPHPIWHGRAGDMQSVFQLASGRIVLPLSYWLPGRDWSHRGTGFDAFNWMGSFRSSALYSDDGGAAWTQSPAVLETPTTAIGELGGIEPDGIQLKDGRIWMLIRTQVGRFYETWSSDAVHWSPPTPSDIRSSDSPALLVRLKDGRLLMFLNSCERYCYSNGGRQVLHAAISSDEGRTWHGWREVWRDPLRDEIPPAGGDYGASYPYATLTSDGDVIFSMWVASGNTRSLIEFNPGWLDETSQTEDFSNGLSGLSTFATHGVSVIADPERPGHMAMQVRKLDIDWPAAAVWNFPAAAAGIVHVRLKLIGGHRGLSIALTDHFSPPSDDQDELYDLFNLRIGADGKIGDAVRLRPGVWHDVELSWSATASAPAAAGQCRVMVDGRLAAVLPQSRLSSCANYLRIRSTAAGERDEAGFLVSSLSAAAAGMAARAPAANGGITHIASARQEVSPR